MQTGLQAFLQKSMEQMFTGFAPAQTQPPAATSTVPPAKAEEPMDSVPSQPAPPEVKRVSQRLRAPSLSLNSPSKRWSLK